tara:strand:- start:24 stop:425 length:402 start_codon:yes stop_codon:yes gene_type:complete
MKTFFITISIFLSSSVLAQGDWIEFGTSSSDDPQTQLTLYYNLEFVEKRNNFLNAVILIDFSPPAFDLVGSAKYLNSIDCVDYKRKMLRQIFYAGPMGEGETIEDESLTTESWEYVLPGSNEHFLLETLCPRF